MLLKGFAGLSTERGGNCKKKTAKIFSKIFSKISSIKTDVTKGVVFPP
jgi:hypothetical protein